MELVVVLALIILIPIALLLWRRHDSGPGEPGTDPQANRDVARHGGQPPQEQQRGWDSAGGHL